MRRFYDTENEAADATAEVMRNVTRHGGRWMAAVWRVNDDGSVTMKDRSTWRFPTMSYLPAVHQLVEACINDMGVPPKVTGTVDRPAPLPMAKPFGVVGEDATVDIMDDKPATITTPMKQVADRLEPIDNPNVKQSSGIIEADRLTTAMQALRERKEEDILDGN